MPESLGDPASADRTVRVEPPDAAALRAFGEVIDRRSMAPTNAINGGTAERVHDLARVDVSMRSGHAALGLVRAGCRRLRCEWVPWNAATWNHPLLVLDQDAEFLVADRVADDGNGLSYQWTGLKTTHETPA